MRILLITVQYYPVLTPNVYRWSAIAEYWVKQGHEVHIVCSRRQLMPNEAIEKGVFLHRAGPATLMDWAYNLFRIKKKRGERGALKPSRYSFTRNLLEKVVNWTWRKIYWPDGSIVWYWPARKRAMKLLKEYRFDAMISVGLPFTAHWISKALKTKSPGLHWLVDIEDPFCYSKEFFVNNNQLYNWTNRRAERAVFSQAQAITVTLDNAKERYVEIFPEAASKMRVIPPLFNLPLLNPKDLGIEGPVRMAYFGSFYENVRTPMEFLELLQKCFEIEPLLIERLEVHFYGELTGMVMENFRKFPKLAPVFHFHGLVSRQEVAEALQSVDILLNIGNKTDYHLPSKSVDYLMSGKPVISLSYVANDPFSNLFDAYPLFKALHVENHYFGKLNQLASQFLDFILQNRGKKVPRRLLDKLGQPYRVEVIAELYLQLLREGQ